MYVSLVVAKMLLGAVFFNNVNKIKMKSIFKVGDIVYHFRYGVGEIIELHPNLKPQVKFKDDRPYAGHYYRKEYVDEDLLSFKKYTIEGLSHERPKSELEL